jgi:hypothetical protein
MSPRANYTDRATDVRNIFFYFNFKSLNIETGSKHPTSVTSSTGVSRNLAFTCFGLYWPSLEAIANSMTGLS